MTNMQTRREAAAERRARDAESLVATIRDGEASYMNYRVYAPKDLGIPTVEISHIDFANRIRLLPHQAEALGAALIDAAKKARECAHRKRPHRRGRRSSVT